MAAAGPSRPYRNLGRPRKPTKHALKPSKLKKITEKQKIEFLEKEASTYDPPEGLKLFADLPISECTKRGLKKAFFVDMTDIQAKSLPVSLKGKDVLGSAHTGSGKTLAFLIPVLEILYRRKWGPQDGLGALIISPTRELAVQIFNVLRSIGCHHTFSAGLVIGGKSLKDERDRLSRMNILVATPGRLLQHMDQTVGFEADNLQILVLDEADRVLDMGFSRTLSALLSHLPKSRQTLLFSATQTQSVNELARLSLKDPVFVGVHELGLHTVTPKDLEQHYLVCELDKKLDILWSFIKTHLQSKVLVFLSSCKQVRFVFETFCKMHPGIPLLHLHGKQKQTARLAMYTKFTSSSHAVLFATDIAARGLDFPSVDWVLQVDAPEDAETYIHRVGRTARYESGGKSLLFLVPSEKEGMKAELERKNISVQMIKVKSSKTQSIQNQLQKFAFQDPEIKYLAQRAFISYMRSVYLQRNKAVFKVAELPLEQFAESLGLPGAPRVKFLGKTPESKKGLSRSGIKTDPSGKEEKVEKGEFKDQAEVGLDDFSEDEEVEDEQFSSKEDLEAGAIDASTLSKPLKPAVRTKYDRMFQRKNQNILSAHYTKLVDHSTENSHDNEETEDFITLKRPDHELSDSDAPHADSLAENLSKRKMKLGKAKRAMAKYGGLARKVVFDEEGNPHEMYEMADPEEFFKDGMEGAKEAGRKFAEDEKDKMKDRNAVDKEEAREKKRERKRKRKDKEKENGVTSEGIAFDPTIASLSGDDGYVSPDFNLTSSDKDQAPTAKRNKTQENWSRTIGDEEELALRLLRGRR